MRCFAACSADLLRGGFALFVLEVLNSAGLGYYQPLFPGSCVDEGIRLARLARFELDGAFQDSAVRKRIGRQPAMHVHGNFDALNLRHALQAFDELLPAGHAGFTLSYRYGASTYRIAVASGTPGAPARLTIDGIVRDDATILLVDDAQRHEVELRLAS